MEEPKVEVTEEAKPKKSKPVEDAEATAIFEDPTAKKKAAAPDIFNDPAPKPKKKAAPKALFDWK